MRAEEQRFGETLEHGMRVFEEVATKSRRSTIPGADAFRLYDTYGFPVDLTADIARERGLEVDMAGFEQAMGEQRERARAAGRFDRQGPDAGRAGQPACSRREFLGYEALRHARAQGARHRARRHAGRRSLPTARKAC